MNQPIRLLLVDDQALFREGLHTLLSTRPEFEVVAEAENGEEGLRLAVQNKPNVILMDLRMPVMDGMDAFEIIVKYFYSGTLDFEVHDTSLVRLLYSVAELGDRLGCSLNHLIGEKIHNLPLTIDFSEIYPFYEAPLGLFMDTELMTEVNTWLHRSMGSLKSLMKNPK